MNIIDQINNTLTLNKFYKNNTNNFKRKSSLKCKYSRLSITIEMNLICMTSLKDDKYNLTFKSSVNTRLLKYNKLLNK